MSAASSTPQISLHRLEGFYWVATTGGYARAARAFPYPITQPAVHQQVKKLEGELGVHLFERVGKDQMSLTPAGVRLFEFVKPFYESLPGILRGLAVGEYGGELRIHTSNLLLRSVMPAWIKRLTKRAPAVQVILNEADNMELGRLQSGKTDLVVDYFPEIPDDIACLQVAIMRPFIVMPKSHRLASRKRVSLSAFGDDSFVAYSPGLYARELQMAALERHGVHPAHMLTASSADAILGFVESGLGYSLLPSVDPAGPRSKGITVLPLSSPKIEFPIYAMWRKDTPENPLLDAALETAPRP